MSQILKTSKYIWPQNSMTPKQIQEFLYMPYSNEKTNYTKCFEDSVTGFPDVVDNSRITLEAL